MRAWMLSLAAALFVTSGWGAAGRVEGAMVTFNYTGAAQSFVVPSGVNVITIDVYGAQGWTDPFGGNLGGRGGYATGDLAVTPGETLWIFVGGAGTSAVGANVPMGGGFNGGGNGMSNTSGGPYTGGGGGASDVRQGGMALTDRVIVGAGGGGATTNSGSFGGNGGGLVGATGGSAAGGIYPGGTGGTQVAGGSVGGAFGIGGSGIPGTNTPWNGGGGGGWYGGGTSLAHAGGGGGSSYIGGVSGGSTTAGVQFGNGFVQLTFQAVPEPTSLALLGIGLFSLSAGAVTRRRRG